jgi:hypothetical protein
LQREVEELVVRCGRVAGDAKAITIEVPPMKRID